MNLNTLLSAIITSASILISVGFPLIIFAANNHNNRKEVLLSEIKTLYPKLNAFRKLIYHVFQLGLWKERSSIIRNFNLAIQEGDNEKKWELIKENDHLSLYEAFMYISKQYQRDIVNDHDMQRIFTFNEISKYQIHTSHIYYDIHCRNDIVKEINSNRFNTLTPYELEGIEKAIKNINYEYFTDKISIESIATIAGELETDITNPLADLTKKYERPLTPIVKKLFGILTISLIFGVIIPLLLLLVSSTYTFYAAIVTVIIMTFCFTAIVVLTGKHIGIL